MLPVPNAQFCRKFKIEVAGFGIGGWHDDNKFIPGALYPQIRVQQTKPVKLLLRHATVRQLESNAGKITGCICCCNSHTGIICCKYKPLCGMRNAEFSHYSGFYASFPTTQQKNRRNVQIPHSAFRIPHSAYSTTIYTTSTPLAVRSSAVYTPISSNCKVIERKRYIYGLSNRINPNKRTFAQQISYARPTS